MSRRAPTLAAVAVAALLLAACGPRFDLPDQATGQQAARAAGDATSEPARLATPAAPPTPATGDATTAADPDATPAAEPEPADAAPAPAPNPPEPDEPETRDDDEDAFPLDVVVEPACVAHGDPIAATIRTVAHAELSMIVAYADGQPHGQMGFADADADGIYVWRWMIPAQAPAGEGTVLVMSVSPDGERADTETAPFDVAGPEGCP